MSFLKLQDNLIEVLRNRVLNGELTERRLAKITGVSQPHIHNVLKGIRELSPELSDRVLLEFHLSLRDLWSAAEPWREPGVPVIQDPLGPRHEFPAECYRGTHPFSVQVTAGLTHPAVFRLARDRQMEPELVEGDLVLVDRSPQVRRTPHPHSLYLIDFKGCGLARYVRLDDLRIYLATVRTREASENWEHANLDGQDILEVIRGRIVWIGRQMETPAGSVDETGPAIGPAGGTG